MWLIVSLLCCITGQTYGSSVTFSSSPPDIQPLITDVLSLRCGLTDSPQPGGAIIGRSLSDDVTHRDIHTSDVQYVTSMVITKAGIDVAAMTEHLKATSFSNDSNINVTGSLNGGQGEKGFLQIRWQYPTQQHIGEYKCDVNGVDMKGHSFDFTKTIEVTSRDITMGDIVNHISQLKHDRDDMNNKIETMEKTDAGLRQTITSLQQKVDTHVFFSVAISKHMDIQVNQAVVYDKIYSNVGGGYNVSNGAFVCPVAGYYHFEINALTDDNTAFKFGLQLNGRVIISIYGQSGYHWQGSSNSATLRLDQHDVIKVVSAFYSVVHDDATHDFVTFSGTLVALA